MRTAQPRHCAYHHAGHVLTESEGGRRRPPATSGQPAPTDVVSISGLAVRRT